MHLIENIRNRKRFVFPAFNFNVFLEPINLFVPNALFPYPLKTIENLNVFGCFQGVKKECIGNKWDNVIPGEIMWKLFHEPFER